MRKEISTVELDGIEWIPRAGGLWADYETAAAYQGVATTGAMRSYAFRHRDRLRTIRLGQKVLLNKADLDAISGAADAA